MTPGELKAARVAANLRQTRLAELTGIHRSDVANMEAGRRTIGPGMAARLREALRARQGDDAMRKLVSYEIVRSAEIGGRHVCRAKWDDGRTTEYRGSGSRGAAYELASRLSQWLGSQAAADRAMAGKRIGAEFADEIE